MGSRVFRLLRCFGWFSRVVRWLLGSLEWLLGGHRWLLAFWVVARML